jgi:SAM-dependent methyltransferase
VRRVSAPSELIAVIGAGASSLITELIAAGYRRIEAIDISSAALSRLVEQLGAAADSVTCRVIDVRHVTFDAPVDVWHDRATFHFLTHDEDQRTYARRAADAVRPGGHLVIAAFAPDGPTECSGLPVARHSAGTLAAVFGEAFELIESFERDHRTPWGSAQRFTHAVLRRTG